MLIFFTLQDWAMVSVWSRNVVQLQIIEWLVYLGRNMVCEYDCQMRV